MYNACVIYTPFTRFDPRSFLSSTTNIQRASDAFRACAVQPTLRLFVRACGLHYADDCWLRQQKRSAFTAVQHRRALHAQLLSLPALLNRLVRDV